MAKAKNKAEVMSNVDAAWLHMDDPTNLMMITGVLMFAEPLDMATLQETVERGLLRYERFRQRVVDSRLGLRPPRWQTDPHFDITAHLHRIALPAPGDQSALEELVSDLMSTPLDYSKPLWQFHLVEGFEQGSALIVRLHHCIADGIALMRVLLSLTRTEREASLNLPEPEHRPEGRWYPLRGLVRPAIKALRTTGRLTGTVVSESLELLTNPGHGLELARTGGDLALALGRLLLLPPDPKTVFKGPLGVRKRAAWSQAISLPEVKRVGKAYGATVNDVLLAAVTGALRSYLEQRKQQVEGLNFRAVVPVNLRPEEEPIKLGNRFGLVFLSLPVGIADPLDRLMEVKQRMDRLKGTPEAMVAFGILNAIGMAPTQIENLVVTIFGAKATAVMTNVPGPQQQLYFAGVPLRQIMFWVPQSGRLGLGISILSYNQQVWLGVGTDVGLVPDPQTIVAAFHREMDELFGRVRETAETAREEKPAAEEAAPAVAPARDDLTRIRGIGPGYAARLSQAGLTTYAALAASSPAELAAIIQAPDWRRPDYESWIQQAQALAQHPADART